MCGGRGITFGKWALPQEVGGGGARGDSIVGQWDARAAGSGLGTGAWGAGGNGVDGLVVRCGRGCELGRRRCPFKSVVSLSCGSRLCGHGHTAVSGASPCPHNRPGRLIPESAYPCPPLQAAALSRSKWLPAAVPSSILHSSPTALLPRHRLG